MSDEINDSFWTGFRYGFTHAIPVLRDEAVNLMHAARSRTRRQHQSPLPELSLKPC